LQIGAQLNQPSGGTTLQLSRLAIALPPGMRLNLDGHPVCSAALFAPSGPGGAACPAGSRAGGQATASGLIPVGSTLEPETMTTQLFSAEGGGLRLVTTGREPVALEAFGPVTRLNTPGGFVIELGAPEAGPAPSPQGAIRYTGLSLALGSAAR